MSAAAAAPGNRVVLVMALASAVTTLGAIAPFLLGAQSVWIREDLRFGEAGLGVAVSTFFLVAAVAALAGGGMVDRVGRRWGHVLAGAFVACGGLGVALVADRWWLLVVSMAVLGVGNAACQVTSNLAVAQALPPGRRGLGFGVKQSAVPLAVLLGGLAVPTTGALFGWRSTFVVLAAGGVAVAVLVPWLGGDGGRSAPRAAVVDRPPRGPLLLCGVGILFASAAANFLGSFLASWGDEVGLSPAQAGLLMAAGSAASITVRVLSGHRADGRHGANLPIVAAQMAAGAVFLVLLTVPQAWAVVVFGFLAFAVGWSWPGLLLYAVARVGRDAPAYASGVVQAGAFAGGAVGPAVLGTVVALYGYTVAWWAGAACFLTASVLVALARRGFLRDLQARPPAEPFGYGGGRRAPRHTTGLSG